MPPLDAALVSVLGCPHCKGPLSVHEHAGSTDVCCSRCRRSWPVEEGVPQLLPERMMVRLDDGPTG